MLFLAVRFNKAQLKLRATSSPIFLTFYTLVWGNVIISLVRCAVSMTMNAAGPVGGLVDKILWVTVRFFLLATEMSVVIFGLAFGKCKDVLQNQKHNLHICCYEIDIFISMITLFRCLTRCVYSKNKRNKN